MDEKSRVGKHVAGRESVPVVDDKRHGVVSSYQEGKQLTRSEWDTIFSRGNPSP